MFFLLLVLSILHIEREYIYILFIIYYTRAYTYIFLAVDRSVWEQLIGLYPYLVECTITTNKASRKDLDTCVQVSRSLREALLQYHDLLRVPNIIQHQSTSNGVSFLNENKESPP